MYCAREIEAGDRTAKGGYWIVCCVNLDFESNGGIIPEFCAIITESVSIYLRLCGVCTFAHDV